MIGQQLNLWLGIGVFIITLLIPAFKISTKLTEKITELIVSLERLGERIDKNEEINKNNFSEINTEIKIHDERISENDKKLIEHEQRIEFLEKK